MEERVLQKNHKNQCQKKSKNFGLPFFLFFACRFLHICFVLCSSHNFGDVVVTDEFTVEEHTDDMVIPGDFKEL